MIAECKTWLRDQLVAAGVEAKGVFFELEQLDVSHPMPFAVIVTGRERLERDGTRVAVETAPGSRARNYRRRLVARTLPVGLVLKHRTEAEADQVIDQVLALMTTGPMDAQGNRYKVTPRVAVWDNEKSATLVQARVTLEMEFEGGVYRDSQVPVFGTVAPEPAGS